MHVIGLVFRLFYLFRRCSCQHQVIGRVRDIVSAKVTRLVGPNGIGGGEIGGQQALEALSQAAEAANEGGNVMAGFGENESVRK